MDILYFGFLPDITRTFITNKDIKNSHTELRLNPGNARAAYSLGVLYFEKKKYDKALTYLEHPKLKNDSTANTNNYLGMTLIELNRINEGKSYILKALELDPRVGYGLPYIYLIKNVINVSNPHSDTIHKLEEKIEKFANTENLYKLGLIYSKSANKEKARQFFSKAIVEYSYCPRGLRRLHRKWAILSRIHKLL